MKKVLVFARDPGGANIIIPLINELIKAYEVEVYAKEYAFIRIKQVYTACRDIELELAENSQEEVFLFLKSKAPDLLITGTSLNDYTERFLWKASELLGIPSFSIVDQWINLGIRFSKYDYTGEEKYLKNMTHEYLPTRIMVMDKYAKNELIKQGIEENQIYITGQPHFDTVREKYAMSQIVKGNNDTVNIIYVSEPIISDYDKGQEQKMYWGYNEKTIFLSLYQSIVEFVSWEKRKVSLIIRPHPREDADKWDEIISSLNSPYIELICDKESDSFDLLKKADVVCGMSSMFLLEAVICEVSVLSIQIGLKRENPFVLDKIGVLKSSLTKAELFDKIKKVLSGEKQNVSFEIIKSATKKVIANVKEVFEDE